MKRYSAGFPLWLVLAISCGIGPRADAAPKGQFAQKRARVRAERVKLQRQAAADRVKRAENAATIIAELITFAGDNRVAGQKDDLRQLLAGLESMAPDQVPELEREMAQLPAPPEPADRALRTKWLQELKRQREAIVSRPGNLLNKAVKLSLADLAYEFLQEILAFDPDREQLRRNLGQVKYKGEWLSRFAYVLATKGIVWDERLGWILQARKNLYEKNYYYDLEQANWRTFKSLGRFKYDRRKWATLDKANQAHDDLRNLWTVRTQHLEIRGNADLEILVEAANKLESFYAQIFAAYAYFFMKEKEDYKLILGMADHAPLVVYIYRNKEDYVTKLGERLAFSAGVFMPGQKASAFYSRVSSTMYHEFTHQILYIFANGCQAPPWLLEGIAVYTQFPTFPDGELRLGDLRANRRVGHHLMAFKAGRHLPLEDLLKIKAYGTWLDVTKGRGGTYEAAGALTYFCMEAENRAYRADFVDFLRDSYRGPAFTRGHKLWEYLGMSREEFSAAYQKWLRETG